MHGNYLFKINLRFLYYIYIFLLSLEFKPKEKGKQKDLHKFSSSLINYFLIYCINTTVVARYCFCYYYYYYLQSH